ncbi:hypothetical protein [Algisphaera agarilytica]|uniref:Uncharacterized protein n=1 Tax=Algisphaera agarilytica TaxID=1385975 RepID=A0A7X0H712_9BACT|nr:hypothetical protein [Algisphaera agarilytica]MBB6429009.1 hypothetical protein [Algisphaera agarilytica]
MSSIYSSFQIIELQQMLRMQRRRRLSRLLRLVCCLGLLLGAVAYSTGCSSPESTSQEPIPPTYRHASADIVGDIHPSTQALPDSTR